MKHPNLHCIAMTSRQQKSVAKLLIITALCIGSTACSLFQARPQTITDSWHAKGKIGIHSPQQKGSAWLDWQQQQSHYKIQLQGPLGLGTMLIQGDAKALDVIYKNTLYSALRPQQLKEITGLDLPLQHFPYWAQGQHSPLVTVTEQTRDQNGDLLKLQQAGWTLQFSRYRSIAAKRLPAKLKLQSGDTRLTMIFKSWVYQ